MQKFIPVRVTSKQRAESFLSGEIYMSPLHRFGSWGRRDGASDVQNNFRGDMTEGAVQVFSDPIEGGLNMLSSIPDSIKPLVDKITWVDLGDLQYYKVLCFYSLLYDASNDWFIAPDPRLAEFGDTALVIIDMDEFMRRMLRALLDKYGEDNEYDKAQEKSYLVQRVNTYAFQHPIELMQNIDRVTQHIRTKHPEAQSLHFHHLESGENYLMDDDGFWRLSNYVPSITFDTCDDLNVVRSAGQAFGEFQMMLSDFDASQLFYTIPDFHDTQKRYAKLKADMQADPYGRVAEAQQEVEWLLSVEDEACKLTDLFNAGKLPLRVTHNDTKINNVLFDEQTHQALVVIDLDTVMPGLVGHDFGDAIRFASNFVEEDCKDADKAGVNLNVYWAFAEGFLKKTAATLTENEVDTLGISCFALACELATRFLDDYITGDQYFKIKYPDHNIVRTRCQIALAKNMQVKMDAMNAIVRDCWMRYR